MKPLTKEQVEALPKGFTASEQPGRKFFRDMKFNRIISTLLGITEVYPMNNRKLTDGKKKHKSFKYGRLDKSDGRTA